MDMLVLGNQQNQGPLHSIPGGRCRGPYTHHHYICHGCVSVCLFLGSIACYPLPLPRSWTLVKGLMTLRIKETHCRKC